MSDITVIQADENTTVTVEETAPIEVSISECQDVEVTIENAPNIDVTLETGIFTVKDHKLLENIGVNTHDQIDAHIADKSPEYDSVDYNNNLTEDPDCIEGRTYWNKEEHTLNICTGLGAELQVNQEQVVLFYNSTGSTIGNGKVLHPVGGTVSEGVIVPEVELADSSDFEKCQGTLFVSTSEVLNGTVGLGTRFGRVRGLNTQGLGAGSQVWIDPSNPGELTAVQPQFPNYIISMGGTLNSSTTDGELFVTITTRVEDTIKEAWDGAIRESFDFRTTSDGTTITGTLTNPNVNFDDLTCMFSTGFYTFDCPADGSITLTPGSATIPQMNYIYILESTKTLTVSTTEFPITEHCKVAKVALLDASTTQTNGTLRNQNLNDHIKTDDDNGHILHIAERVRQLNADWDSGAAATLSGATTDLYISTTSGVVWQMHKQSFPAQDMSTGDDIHVVNDFTAPYRTTSNLNDITSYSDGSTWNNEWSNIVVWGVCNKTGEPSHIMVNLPSDGYNSEENAIEDRSNFSNYNIPREFRGVGFLIGRFTIRRSGTSFTYNGGTAYTDLRGTIPNNIAGGGGGGGVSSFLALEDVDPSSYVGQAGKVVTVNSGETGLEFTTPSSGGGGASVICDGGLISNNATDADHTIDISQLFDTLSSDRTQTLAVSADSLDIQLNASWASGTAPTLTDASIHVWADYNLGTQRYILDDATGSNISGAKRRVGSFITDSAGDIIPFESELVNGGVEIRYTEYLIDASFGSNASSSWQTAVLSKPLGIVSKAIIFYSAWVYTGTKLDARYRDTLTGVERKPINLPALGNNQAGSEWDTEVYIPTNSSNEIDYLINLTAGGSYNGGIQMLGFLDERSI